MGQHFMRSELKGMPGSSTLPSFANFLLLLSQVKPSCHSNLQLLQKSVVQFGQ
jgi:hypothetical protein